MTISDTAVYYFFSYCCRFLKHENGQTKCTVTNKFLIFGEKYNLRDTTALNDTVKWQIFDSISCSIPLRHTRYGAGRVHQTAVDEEEEVVRSFLSVHRTVTNGEKHPAANTKLAPLKWHTLHLEMSLKLTDCWLAIMSIKHWSLFFFKNLSLKYFALV